MPRGFHFEYRTKDEDLRREFERFINNNVQILFSDARAMTKNYVISDIDARSVVNLGRTSKSGRQIGGKYRSTLEEVANEIQVPSSNNSPFARKHIAQTLATVHGIANGNFQKLIEELRSLMKAIVESDYRYNIVWYTKYFDVATRM